MYLVHRVRGWPSFDQVLTARLVPGTVRTLAGHPLDDDVAAIRFDQAQRAEVGREDMAERRLTAGEVASVAFPLTRSPSFSRGFTVQVEVERELYLEIQVTQLTAVRAAHGVRATKKRGVEMSITRTEVIRRAATIWPLGHVPYSQMAVRNPGYRTDCSGYVSLCLDLGTPGLSTVTLVTEGLHPRDHCGRAEAGRPGRLLRAGHRGERGARRRVRPLGEVTTCTWPTSSTAEWGP